jgi:hypothetical protein
MEAAIGFLIVAIVLGFGFIETRIREVRDLLDERLPRQPR